MCLNAVEQRIYRFCHYFGHHKQDRDEALKLYISGWNNVHGTPSARIICAQKAAYKLTKKSDRKGSYFMFDKAIKFLSKISTRRNGVG